MKKDEFPKVREIVDNVIEEICEYYCKYPSECETEEELYTHCDDCPLNDL